MEKSSAAHLSTEKDLLLSTEPAKAFMPEKRDTGNRSDAKISTHTLSRGARYVFMLKNRAQIVGLKVFIL